MKTNQTERKKLGEIAEFCTCFNIRKAARAVTRHFEEVMRPTGLRATQYSLLVATALTSPVPVQKLAGAMGMDRTTLTRNLGPLLKEKRVMITPGEDRRVRMVSITPRGRSLLNRAVPLWNKAQSNVVRNLGKERWTQLTNYLGAVNQIFQG